MTPTGHRDRAAIIAEHIRNRGRITEHVEHTKEIVRQDLPQDVIDLIRAMARRQSDLEARVAALETAVALMSSAKLDEQVGDLRAALAALARDAARAA